MKTRCPNCGAVASLDLLLAANAASQSFAAALDAPPELKKPLIQYLGLFRSSSRELTHSRAAKLLQQITPHINTGELTFDKTTTPAPIPAWAWAIEEMLSRAARNSLSLPLANHHYLYRVVQGFDPRKHQVDMPTHTQASSRATQIPDDLAQQLKQDQAERKAKQKETVPMPAEAAEALKQFTRNTKNF